MIFLIYLLILILQIILLVKSIKKKERNMWIATFAFEIVSFAIAVILLHHFDYLPVNENDFFAGFTYFAETLSSFYAMIAYIAMIVITASACIITFECGLKRQGKIYANPIVLIIAVICLMSGFFLIYDEVSNNIGIMETTGTIVDVEESKNSYIVRRDGTREKTKDSIISFVVDGKEYQDTMLWEAGQSVGDEIEICYSESSGDEEYRIRYMTNNKWMYIPQLVLAALLIGYRVRKGKKYA